jgi:PKD repeat protein
MTPHLHSNRHDALGVEEGPRMQRSVWLRVVGGGAASTVTAVFLMAVMVSPSYQVAVTPPGWGEIEACAGEDQSVDPGTAVHLDGTCSEGFGTLQYHWYFGDGEESTSPSPSHLYDAQGDYQVTLIVKDGKDRFDLDTVRVVTLDAYPVAIIGERWLDVDEDEVIPFDPSLSFDRDDDITAVAWDFGDGERLVANDLPSGVTSHAYPAEGFYEVSLTVTDNDGALDRDYADVWVHNVVPTAIALAGGADLDVMTVVEDDTVHFDASLSDDTPSDLPTLEYGWDFGDGALGFGIAATHTYTKAGQYTATLTVKDNDDAVAVDSVVVTVLNLPPIASAGPDQAVSEGETVFFDGSASTDTPTDVPLLDYGWSFGGDGTNPTFTWYDDGRNVVTFEVRDDDGAVARDTAQVDVANVAPVAGIVAAYVPVDLTLRASGERWHDVNLRVMEVQDTVSQVRVFRLPGSPDDQSVTAWDVPITIAEDVLLVVEYTPLDDPINGQGNGDSPVWLTLTFEDGASVTEFHNFNVQHPEGWVWTLDANAYLPGHPVHFEGALYDPGTDDIATGWDFGDGTTLTGSHPSGGVRPMRITEHVVHTFADGTFTLQFSGTDDDGGSGAMAVIITQGARLRGTNLAPRATASGGSSVLEDGDVGLAASGDDTGSDQSWLTFAWDLRDGSVRATSALTHAYGRSGVYHPTVEVTDPAGAVGVDSAEVLVLNVPPAAEFTASSVNPVEDEAVVFDAALSWDTPSDLPGLRYAWDFGDGSKGAGKVAAHTFTRQGSYEVTLRTTDDNGASDASVQTIAVTNLAPGAVDIQAEGAADEDEVLFFRGYGEDTPSDEPGLAFAWDFGDGVAATGRNPTHAFTSPGRYEVTLRVTDNDGTATEAKRGIDVANILPQAFGGFPRSYYGARPEVDFDGIGLDTRSDRSSLTYRWDFDDGSTAEAPSVSHIFPTLTVQTYSVSLTVTDEHGAADIARLPITTYVDSDGDRLYDGDEIAGRTDPRDADTDGDGLLDRDELVPPGVQATDPRQADTDLDGCSDWEEVYAGQDGYVTWPDDSDSDDDGLTDCQELYTQVFRTTERRLIGPILDFPFPISSGTVVALEDVKSTDFGGVARAEARIGVTHPSDIGRLNLTLQHGATQVNLRRFQGGDLYLFESFDLLSLGFTVADFAVASTWSLVAGDRVPGGGYVEYFEIHVTTRTSPRSPDSDGDGLSDFEEVQRAEDGWLTDPWVPDTDRDGLSDGAESEGFRPRSGWPEVRTDPTSPDTDRDGFRDDVDNDPLHNLMAMIEITYVDIWGENGDGEPEPFLGITFDDGDGDATTIYTKHYGDGYDGWDLYEDMDRIRDGLRYTFEVPDDDTSVQFTVRLFDDDTGDDDKIDINPVDGMGAWTASYTLAGGSWSNCYFTRSEDSSSDDLEGEVHLCLSTVRLPPVHTLLLDTKDPSAPDFSLLYEASDGSLRYLGEDRYYVALFDVEGASEHFAAGYNAVVIPRRTFLDSNLAKTLRELDDGEHDVEDRLAVPAYVAGLQFAGYDLDAPPESTSSAILGVLQTAEGEALTGGEAEAVLALLATGEYTEPAREGGTRGGRAPAPNGGGVIAVAVDVTSHLYTLGLGIEVLRLIPINEPVFGFFGEDPDGFFESVGEVFEDLAELVWDTLVAIASFIADVVELILNMIALVIHVIIELIEWVVKLIVLLVIFLAKLLLWIIDYVVGLIKDAINWIINKLISIVRDFVDDVAAVLAVALSEYQVSASTGGIRSETVDDFDGALVSRFFFLLAALTTAAIVVLYYLTPLTSVFGFLMGFLAGFIKDVLWEDLLQPMFDDLGGDSGTDRPDGDFTADGEASSEEGAEAMEGAAREADGSGGFDCVAGFKVVKHLADKSLFMDVGDDLAKDDPTGTLDAEYGAFLGAAGVVLSIAGSAKDNTMLTIVGGWFSYLAVRNGMNAADGVPQMAPLGYAIEVMGVAGALVALEDLADSCAWPL